MIGIHPLAALPVSSNSIHVPRSSSTEPLYTISECIYQVSTSGSQKLILGFMGASLVINFGILVWWLRGYCYKRASRKREKQVEPDEYSYESSTEDMEMDHRSIDKEVEVVHSKYRPSSAHAEDERASLPDETRYQGPRREVRAIDPPPRVEPRQAQRAVDARAPNDRLDADVVERRDNPGDFRKEEMASRRGKEREGPGFDVSGSERVEASHRAEKRRRNRDIDRLPEET